jgi:hypothetical protein
MNRSWNGYKDRGLSNSSTRRSEKGSGTLTFAQEYRPAWKGPIPFSDRLSDSPGMWDVGLALLGIVGLERNGLIGGAVSAARRASLVTCWVVGRGRAVAVNSFRSGRPPLLLRHVT